MRSAISTGVRSGQVVPGAGGGLQACCTGEPSAGRRGEQVQVDIACAQGFEKGDGQQAGRMIAETVRGEADAQWRADRRSSRMPESRAGGERIDASRDALPANLPGTVPVARRPMPVRRGSRTAQYRWHPRQPLRAIARESLSRSRQSQSWRLMKTSWASAPVRFGSSLSALAWALAASSGCFSSSAIWPS